MTSEVRAAVVNARLSAMLMESATRRVPECQSNLEFVALLYHVATWLSHGYVSTSDLVEFKAAAEGVQAPIDVSQLSPEDRAVLQAILDAATVSVSKSVTANGTYDPRDEGAAYYDEVEVSVQQQLAELVATENGVYVAADDEVYGYSQVTVSTVAYTHEAVEVAHASDYMAYSIEVQVVT